MRNALRWDQGAPANTNARTKINKLKSIYTSNTNNKYINIYIYIPTNMWPPAHLVQICAVCREYKIICLKIEEPFCRCCALERVLPGRMSVSIYCRKGVDEDARLRIGFKYIRIRISILQENGDRETWVIVFWCMWKKISLSKFV